MSEFDFVLRRKRTFGETLNATFAFVRIHARILLRALMQLVFPTLVVIAGMIVIITQNFFVGVELGGSLDEGSTEILAVLVMLLCLLLFSIAFAIASAVYYAVMRLALEKGTNFDLTDIRAVVRKTVWSLIGMYFLQLIFYYAISAVLMIPAALFLGAGLVEFYAVSSLINLCIQLAVLTYFSLSYAVLVIEKRTVFNSIQRSMNLVKGYFWRTVGLVATITIIVYLMMLAPVVHPLLIATALYKLFDPVALGAWLLNAKLVVTLIGAVYGLFVALSFFFVWMFPTTAIAIHYISLVEAKEGLGLAIKVNTLLPPVPLKEETVVRVQSEDEVFTSIASSDSPPAENIEDGKQADTQEGTQEGESEA